MVEERKRLLNCIEEEYNNNLSKGMNPDKAAIMSINSFIKKYNYDKEIFNNAFKDLQNMKIVDKWILGCFVYKADR